MSTMSLTAAHVYMSVLTLAATICLPQPCFGYAVVTVPDHIWGNTFSFIASANHAIVVNLFVAGLYALYKEIASVPQFIHTHVALFVLTYITLLLFNIIAWDNDKIEWSSTVRKGEGGLLTDPPPELVTVVAVPMVLFNFVLLPLYLWRQQRTSTCLQVTMVAA